MVLTDRQRNDLHAGIYEYLCSRKEFIPVADVMRTILPPEIVERYSNNGATNSTTTSTNTTTNSTPTTPATPTSSTTTLSSNTPILEKKWTAIPRLQKKVLELEKYINQSNKIHAHRMNNNNNSNNPSMMMMMMGYNNNNNTMNGNGSDINDVTTGVATNNTCRMLPRLPPTHILNGHSNVVTCCTIHPIYTITCSGSEDGSIKVWDYESGDYIRTLKGHTNTVNSIQFSPVLGQYMVSCSTDLSIKLWDMNTYQCLRTLRGHDHTISAICFIPNSSNNNDNNNNTDSGTIQQTSSKGNDNNRIGTGIDVNAAYSQYILSASRDTTVKCWDIETGFCDYTISNDHTDWIRCITIRQCDGSIWASGGNDQMIHVYDTITKRKIITLRGHEHVIESIAFTTEETSTKKNSSSSLTSSSNNNNNSTQQLRPNKHYETVREYLVSGSRDRSVKLWNITEGSCTATYTAHENWVRSVLLHPSGLYIISASDDKSIRIYDIKNSRCLRTLDNAHSHFITCLAMHPTLPILISGSVDQTVRCWLLQ